MVTADPQIGLHDQMIYARNTLKDQLSTLDGVGNILFAGYVEPNLRVWVDRNKLYRLNMTSTDIINAIQSEQIEQPAGRIESATSETNIRVVGEARSAEEFGRIRINTRNGGPNYRPVPLTDVARIEEGVSDIRQISRFNGKTAVGLGIVKQHGSNAVEVSRLIHAKVAAIQKNLMPGYHVDVRLDTTQFIRDSVSELNSSLIFSGILTSIVCFLFLGSWSSTLNVFLAIPTSIVGAFMALYFFGFTLNTFTLLGLSLAIGIVVDDAIMMLENIVRHYEMGKNRRQAALDGSNEITFAAIATTVAIAAIFIPVVFMKGVIGKFFYQYGITVTVTVFLSLLEAVTLTPMRCARFLDSGKDKHSGKAGWLIVAMDGLMEKISARYRKALEWCLNRQWKVILASLGIFGVSMFLVVVLRKELVPAQDQSLFLVSLKTKVGASIQATNEVYLKAEKLLSEQPEIADLYTTIGNYQNNNVVNAGVIYVMLKDPRKRSFSQREVMDHTKKELKKLLPEVEVSTQDLSLTGFSASRGFPIEFTLEGPDWKTLGDTSKKLVERLEKGGILEDINMDFQSGMPEVHVVPDRAQAAAHGVSVATLAQEVGALIGGQLFTANTQYPKDNHRYYIRMRSLPETCAKLSDLEDLLLSNDRGTGGTLVPLGRTSKIEMTSAPQLISRVNRSRAIPVFANIASGQSQQAAMEHVLQVGREVLPKHEGYTLSATGSAQAFREAFDGLKFALLLGVVVAYMVLASQFNSFVHPVTVLMALPFSLTGAFFALFVTQQSLSLFSMIGLILLMGIVKKNSILLVDFTNQRRAEGLPPVPALLEACPVRLRPILMTSVATIAGALPAALNFGPGAETRIPMAVSIIGGVLVSTVLTLFVVPCVYSVFTRVERPEQLEETGPLPGHAR